MLLRYGAPHAQLQGLIQVHTFAVSCLCLASSCPLTKVCLGFARGISRSLAAGWRRFESVNIVIAPSMWYQKRRSDAAWLKDEL